MLASTVVLVAIGFYLMIGVLQDPKAAAIYLRNIVLPFLLFQLALLTASRYRLRVTPLLVTIAVVFIGCGFFEFAFRETWLALTNGRTYWYLDGLKAMDAGVWEKQMRATGSVMVDLLDRFRVSFFNTPLLEPLGLTTVLRLFGPNISAVSFAYGVGFFVLFLTATGRYLLALAGFALLILCSVKGALLMVLFVLAALVATRLIGPVLTLALLLVMLVVYAAVVIVSGLKIGDYHVIGLMGGVNGFLQQPFGPRSWGRRQSWRRLQFDRLGSGPASWRRAGRVRGRGRRAALSDGRGGAAAARLLPGAGAGDLETLCPVGPARPGHGGVRYPDHIGQRPVPGGGAAFAAGAGTDAVHGRPGAGPCHPRCHLRPGLCRHRATNRRRRARSAL
ncbi:MAG: hypothetical protein MZV49_22955 [Rhodopseudomonas palustris]|nr:hypothetical protein [Rhodopseudomonas palustris]